VVAPDFLTLAAYFAIFIAIALLAWFENRAMLQKSETISAFLHAHVFSAFLFGAWITFGLGLLVGHFISGPVYCGPPA